MKRNILLIEPDYKNKYPPIGLMKLSTYHKELGDNVVFFKGNLKNFVITCIVDDAIKKLSTIDRNRNWQISRKNIFEFIKTGKTAELSLILDNQLNYTKSLETWLIYFKDLYRKKKYIDNPRWDRICITTLFTFHYDLTIDTINFAKNLVKDVNDLHIGGVLASVLPNEIESDTGIKPHVGLLDKASILDDNDLIIDHLPLDYSILNEIEYNYPANNAFYGYATRGCIRKCSFCAVPKIEPQFDPYISINNQISYVRELYGDKQNLLLLDNNVLASKYFEKIIQEIKDNGFEKNATFIEPNFLEINIRNLKNKLNDRAYIGEVFNNYIYLLNKAKGDDKQRIYDILKLHDLLEFDTVTKKSLLKVFPLLNELFEKYRNKVPKQRIVDFNQGVDARLLTSKRVKLLSEIAIKPLRIAFDSMKFESTYIKAITLCSENGIKSLSNYLLYNENDKPIELYQRLKINIDLSEQLDVNIYSFPMKYHPIIGEYSHNRDYIGPFWNRKFIRAIQTILNATKGKIGKGKDFFYKAFGETEKDFHYLLYMPEPYILYRFFFEEIGYTQKWKEEYISLSKKNKEMANVIIEKNIFTKEIFNSINNKKVKNLISHYMITRDEILDVNTYVGKLKSEYDINGTISPSLAQSC